jgi:hypothetical protein
MHAMPPEPPRMLDHRKLLWWAFWFVFLTTPVCAVFLPSALRHFPLQRFLPLPVFLCCLAGVVAGAFAAGFILAKLTTKTNAEFISRGIGYGLGLVTVYAIIAFAGCLLVVKL